MSVFEFDEFAAGAPAWYADVKKAIDNDRVDEARSLADAALSKKKESASCIAVATARLAAGDTIKAKAAAEEAVTLAGGDKKAKASALHLVAKILLKDNLLRDADTQASAALQEYTAAKDDLGCAAVKTTIARCKKDAGEAADMADEAIAMFQKLKNTQGHASVLYVKVYQKLSQGSGEQALMLAEEMAKLYESAKLATTAAAAKLLSAQIHSATGNHQDAALGAKDAAEAFGKLGDTKKKSDAINVMADILRRAGMFGDAFKAADASLALCRETGDKKGQAAALCVTATIADSQKDYSKAAFKLERAAKLYKQAKDTKEEAKTLEAAASVQMKVIHMLDDAADPEKLCRKALALYKDIGLEQSADYGYCLQTLSFAMLLQGKKDEALREAEASINLFRELSNGSGEAAALNKLAQIHWSRKEKDDAAKVAAKAQKVANDAGDSEEAEWAGQLLRNYGGVTDGSGNELTDDDLNAYQFTDASGAMIRTMAIYMYVYGKDYCIFSGATWRGAADRTNAIDARKASSTAAAEEREAEAIAAQATMEIDWQT